jgi:cyclase
VSSRVYYGLLAVVVCLSGISPATALAQGDETETAQAEIAAVIEKFRAAWRQEDGPAIVESVLSDNAFAFVRAPFPGAPAARVLDKHAYVAAFREYLWKQDLRQHEHQIQSITVLEPLACELGTIIDISASGEEARVEVFNVFAKERTGWKLVVSTTPDFLKPARQTGVAETRPATEPARGSAASDGRLPPVRTIPVAKNVYLLAGAGGNLALSIGDDGGLLVDSEYAAMTDKVLAAAKELNPAPIRYIVNTHWHFDHVGGNLRLARAGTGIIAHENVRRRMSTEQVIGHIDHRSPPSPPAALPVLTYTDNLTLHWNGDDVRVIHVPPAHTDGDSFVYFEQANVLHVGDVYFAEGYPFIDVRAGGSLDGMIRAVDRALDLANDQTKIIPGHGPLSDTRQLREYRKMLATACDRVRTLVQQGKSRDEVLASKPTRDLDEKWGHGGFEPDQWVGIVYDGMVGLKP